MKQIVNTSNETGAVAIATVTNKALTSNVATLDTAAAHGLEVGDEIEVSGVGAPFDGEYTVASVVDANTFTYAKTNANVASAAATGTVSLEPSWIRLDLAGGRSNSRVRLLNKGPGVISYDLAEPAATDDLAEIGFSLAVNGEVEIGLTGGEIYVVADQDNTDLRYAVVS